MQQHKLEEVGGQAVLGRQYSFATPWLTERHGYDPTGDLLQTHREEIYHTPSQRRTIPGPQRVELSQLL